MRSEPLGDTCSSNNTLAIQSWQRIASLLISHRMSANSSHQSEELSSRNSHRSQLGLPAFCILGLFTHTLWSDEILTHIDMHLSFNTFENKDRFMSPNGAITVLLSVWSTCVKYIVLMKVIIGIGACWIKVNKLLLILLLLMLLRYFQRNSVCVFTLRRAFSILVYPLHIFFFF